MANIRERKKTMRREAILTCARRLFGKRGFDATPMESIAACADISPATLYNFFPTKLDILTELFSRDIETQLEKARKSLCLDDLDVLDAVVAVVASLFETLDAFDRGLLRRVTLNALNEGPDRDAGARYVLVETEMADEIEALLRMRQSAGELPKRIDLPAIARAIFAAGNGEFYVWLGDDAAELPDVVQRVRRHIEIILSSVRKGAA